MRPVAVMQMAQVNIEIRIADMNDGAAIACLADQLGYPTSIRQSELRLGPVLRSPEHAVFVACRDGEVIGWVHVFTAQRLETDPFAEIGGFVVAESHRRHGIGRQLVAAAEKWARERGVAALRVRSRLNRGDAHRFYEQLGFARYKEQRVFAKPLKNTD